MRNISSAARQAMYASETADALYTLLTINHEDLESPIRVYNANEWENGNPKVITSNGYDYIAFPFDLVIPEEGGESPPQVTLTICNVDRTIVDAIRSIPTRITITLQIVLSESVDTVEAGPFTLQLTDVEYNAFTITGTLIYDQILSETFPKDKMDATIFPGLF